MASKKEEARVSVLERKGTDMSDMSSKSSSASLKSPRAARFAEDTAVISPIEPSGQRKAPWAHDAPSSTHLAPQPQPADVGFGYIGDRASAHSSKIAAAVDVPMTPRSPLKSALKSPGAPPRMIPSQNPLSPTWQEEDMLDKEEDKTEKQQQKDVVSRIWSLGLPAQSLLIVIKAYQSPRAHRQDLLALYQFLLQSYRYFHDGIHLHNLQRFALVAAAKQSSAVGPRHDKMACYFTPGYIFRFPVPLCYCALEQLAQGPS